MRFREAISQNALDLKLNARAPIPSINHDKAGHLDSLLKTTRVRCAWRPSGCAGSYRPALPFRAREGWRGPSGPAKAAMVRGERLEGEVIGVTGGSLEATPSSS
jgi:hypothetical protein